ncbi:phosphoenolpyruvate--protein phosphotransferase [Pantoea sp. App145]|uniref:phosphoenolpyruvate--protein phosphotransferase n=1 Tax=Pantoea sp. App145 TaxID=3071567 RepID=UPI003A7F7B9F
MVVEITWQCELNEGIHARPAGHIARLCNTFEAEMVWHNTRTQLEASAKSALSLVATDTLRDDICLITVSGSDAPAAAAALKGLLYRLPEFNLEQESEHALVAGSLPRCLLELRPLYLCGIRISVGIAVAKPCFMAGVTFTELLGRSPTDAFSPQSEKRRLAEGLENLRRTKMAALAQAEGIEYDLIEAHLSFITDSAFEASMIGYLDEHRNAWSAIVRSAMDFSAILERSSSHYIQERTLDLLDIATQLLTGIYGEQSLAQNFLMPDEPVIVFASALTPSQFLAINKTHLAGLVLSSTGATSHTAILARSLGIPALADIDFSALTLPPNQDIVLDSDQGILITVLDEKIQRYYRHEIDVQQQMRQKIQEFAQLPSVTADGHHIGIAANIASVEEAQVAFANGAEAIGLFRSEMAFMARETPPDYPELEALYHSVVTLAAGRPVVFRTFDIGGDKPVSWLASGREDNPALGYRAVRSYPQHRQLFAMQLKAILSASAIGDARILLPMIARPEEVIWCREVLEAVKQEMRDAGHPFNPAVELGIMLEVPSVLFAIADMAEHVDFFSLGSNDLAQYFFAADRGNPRVSAVYDNYAPAFLRAMQQAVTDVHRAGKRIALCGELAADNALLPLLVGIGFDELSMSGSAIPAVKHALKSLNFTRCQGLARQINLTHYSAQAAALLQSAAATKSHTGKPLLTPETILWELDAADKNEVIKKMVDNLWLHQRTDCRDKLCQDIWAREIPFPTVVGSGFAIPHARTDAIHDSTISVATLRQPVSWGGVPVDKVFMLTISQAAAENEHMKYFSTLARMLMNDEFVVKAQRVATPEALCDLIISALSC